MESKYCICGLYETMCHFFGRESCYGKMLFLGVDEHRIYTFSEEPNSDTLVFDTLTEAKQYMKEHKLGIRTQSHFTNIQDYIVNEITFLD